MSGSVTLDIFQTKTIGEAFEIVNAMGTVPALELIPASQGAAVVVSRESSVGDAPKGARRISDVPAAVMEAWLGLQNPPLEGRLEIFESEDVGAVFEAAKRMATAGLSVFDLRILRGGDLKAYVMATGSSIAPKLSDLSGRVTSLANPSESVKEFFKS